MQITLQIKKITGAKVMPAWLDGCLFTKLLNTEVSKFDLYAKVFN